jgi:hypothetical protein
LALNSGSLRFFVHGLFLNLCLRYRECTKDQQYDPLIHRVASALVQAYRQSETGILPSYPGMCWPTDNLPSLSALVMYDRLFHRNFGEVKTQFLDQLRSQYMDRLGLVSSYIDPQKRLVLQGGRGISVSYALHFLPEVDLALAREQYGLFKRHLLRDAFGFAAVREYPEGEPRGIDVDSGAVIFGLGTAASGFAIAAAAVMRDEAVAAALLRSVAVAGLPGFRQGELRYHAMPPVGQAVILFGKTERLRKD